AALVLAAPGLLTSTVPVVRAHLACVDLPEGSPSPTLVLASAARRQLQQECLIIRLRSTVLADYPRLLSLAAVRAIEDGTVDALLSSDALDTLVSEFAYVVWISAMVPGSSGHWAYHDFLNLPVADDLTRSYSADFVRRLSERSCTCAPRDADLALLYQELRDVRRDFDQQLSFAAADSSDPALPDDWTLDSE